MGTRRRLAALATVVATLGSAAPLAQGAANDCPKVFNAAIHYQLAAPPACTGPICTFVFEGSGGSTLGRVTDTLTVVQNFASTPCSTFTSEHTFSFEAGTLSSVQSGTVCATPGGVPIINGTGPITGGTGALATTSGTLTSEGVIGPKGPVVRFHGTLDC
jgi:hypothetical protein